MSRYSVTWRVDFEHLAKVLEARAEWDRYQMWREER